MPNIDYQMADRILDQHQSDPLRLLQMQGVLLFLHGNWGNAGCIRPIV